MTRSMLSVLPSPVLSLPQKALTSSQIVLWVTNYWLWKTQRRAPAPAYWYIARLFSPQLLILKDLCVLQLRSLGIVSESLFFEELGLTI
jgi:hypothetical protein